MWGLLMWLLGQRSQWFTSHVFFISWNRWWKGVYIHFLPKHCYRVFLFGVDRHAKNPFGGGHAAREQQRKE